MLLVWDSGVIPLAEGLWAWHNRYLSDTGERCSFSILLWLSSFKEYESHYCWFRASFTDSIQVVHVKSKVLSYLAIGIWRFEIVTNYEEIGIGAKVAGHKILFWSSLCYLTGSILNSVSKWCSLDNIRHSNICCVWCSALFPEQISLTIAFEVPGHLNFLFQALVYHILIPKFHNVCW